MTKLITVYWYEAIARWAEGDEVIGKAYTQEDAQELIDEWDDEQGNPYFGFGVEIKTATGFEEVKLRRVNDG